MYATTPGMYNPARACRQISPTYLPSLGKDALGSGMQVPHVSFLIVGWSRINRNEPLAYAKPQTVTASIPMSSTVVSTRCSDLLTMSFTYNGGSVDF